MMNILKTTFLLILILGNTNCFSQKNKCKNQIEIIKLILNDVQFNNLIINKSNIRIENSICTGKISVQNDKEKLNLSFLNKKIKSDDKISFIEYEETDKLFTPNYLFFIKMLFTLYYLRKKILLI